MTCAYQFTKLKFVNYKNLAIHQVLLPPNIHTIWYMQIYDINYITQIKLNLFLTHLPRQTYPAAEEASPAAVGQLFSEHI